MRISICKKFEIEASHFLPKYEGACRQLHGHSYKLEVKVSASNEEHIRNMNGSDTGMVMDFAKLKNLIKQHVVDIMDHSNLNESTVVYPTAEYLILWIYKQLESLFIHTPVRLERIRLYETSTSYAEWDRNIAWD